MDIDLKISDIDGHNAEMVSFENELRDFVLKISAPGVVSDGCVKMMVHFLDLHDAPVDEDLTQEFVEFGQE